MAYKGRVLSIEVGVQTTRICEMDYLKKKPTVYNCCTFETPDGAVEDGYIRNREILSVAMKDAIKKSSMKSTNVVFTISSSKIANREVNMPVVNDAKIKGLIAANAKDYFPVNIDEYVVTYKVIEKITEGEEKNLRVLVLAAPSTLIESYYDFVKMLGFEIQAIDYVGNSCFQVVKRQTGDGINVVVQLNEQNTLINILDAEILALQRTVPYGMNAMIEAALNCGEFDIVDRESAMEKLFGDTLINAKLNESVIDEVALSYMENNDDSYATQLKQMKAKDEITETFNYLISNVVRVLDYYVAKNPDKKVTALHLSGIGSRINGIGHLFKNEIFLDVDKFENILGINFDRTCMIADAMKSDYAVAVGAAIDPVDFIPKEHMLALKSKSEAKGATLIFTCCLIGSFLLGGFGFVKYFVNNNEKTDLKNAINGMSNVKTEVDKLKTAENIKKNVDGIYVNSLNSNYLLEMLIEEFETYLPKGTTISSINANTKNISININTTSIEMAGEALVQLRTCNLIQDIKMNSLSSSQDENGLYSYAYTVECTPVELNYSSFLGQEVNEAFINTLINGEEESKSNKEASTEEKNKDNSSDK